MQLKRKQIEVLDCSRILSYLNSKYLRFVSLQGASRDAGRDVISFLYGSVDKRSRNPAKSFTWSLEKWRLLHGRWSHGG
jgi:hypothetical protein